MTKRVRVRARRHSPMPAAGLEDENLDPFAASADGDEDGGELVDDPTALKRARELFHTIPSFRKGKGVLQPPNLNEWPDHTRLLNPNPLFTAPNGEAPTFSTASFLCSFLVTFWFPQTWYSWYFNECPLKCVQCHSSEHGSDGSSTVRKVSVGSGEVHGLMCQRLICHACQARFSVLHPGVIAQYPDFVRQEFNVTITRRGQGLTLVRFSAQLEPCLTHKNTLHTLNTPSYPLNTGHTTSTRIPYPIKNAQVELRSDRV